jgi:hypothetical protein
MQNHANPPIDLIHHRFNLTMIFSVLGKEKLCPMSPIENFIYLEMLDLQPIIWLIYINAPFSGFLVNATFISNHIRCYLN